jgi:M6 family metalloprotease-like protein
MRARTLLLILALLVALFAGVRAPPAAADASVRTRPHLVSPSPATDGWPPQAVQGTPLPPDTLQTTGTARMIVLLVEFTDVTHDPSRTPAAIDGSLNGEASGARTLRSYYKEVSFGALTISATVTTVWRPSAETMSWYGADSSTEVDRQNGEIRVLAAEAVKLFDASVDFRDFDSDGDGEVDHLLVVHAGQGQEADPENKDLIWSHHWEIVDDPFVPGPQPLVADGTRIHRYAMVSEFSPVGVVAHEFGHDLGLPDLYDTDGSSDGAGLWDLMAGGSWNGAAAGDSPAHLSAWSRIELGWVTPTEVTTALVNAPIPAVETSGRVYRLGAAGLSGTESFLVENRQPVGFDAALPGSGLLIWHVDESRGATTKNDDETHRWVDLEEADEAIAADRPRDADDPWKDTGAGWGPDTVPSSRLYTGAATGWRVRDISSSTSTMTATIARDLQEDLAVSVIRLPFMARVMDEVNATVVVRNDGARPGDIDLRVGVYRDTLLPAARLLDRTFTQSGLASDATVEFSLSFDANSTGRYIVLAALQETDDEIPSNDERVAHVLVNGFRFRDDVEMGTFGWTTNDDGSTPSANRWRIVDASASDGAAHSRSHSWRLGYIPTVLANPFPPEWHHLTSPPINVGPGPTHLLFYGRYDLFRRALPLIPIGTGETEDAYVEVRYGSGPWIKMVHYTGRDVAWRGVSLNLSANTTAATTLQVRFNATSQGLGNSTGWWLDDIMVADLGLGRAVLLLGSAGVPRGSAGGAVRISLKVANVGEIETDFRLAADLPSGWNATIEAETSVPLQGHVVRLAPDTDIAVRVVLSIPPGATSGAVYPITVSVAAVSDPNVSASWTSQVRVAGFPIEPVLIGSLFAAGIVIVLIAAVGLRRRRRGPPI